MTINEDKRKAIHTLFKEGKKKKEIARLLNLTPKTVRKILNASPDYKAKQRSDKKVIDIEMLGKLYKSCKGYVQRVYEILSEEEGIEIGYSTLCRMIRDEGIGQKINKRCAHVGDIPGEEMQHDTTTYKIKIGDKIKKVICSGLYYRYSKIRYIKFYQHFNRFKMKCFLYEALTYWGYSAGNCIIDNTNLAVLHGTGEQAVFNPEMIIFAKPYGFQWLAHEQGHANRKAGKERNFRTVDTNFLPGRAFKSLEDLNRQAFEWATQRYANRRVSKTHIIPVVVFEQEKPDLIKLPDYVEPPSQPHQRIIDQYGYIAFNANYYWIPGKSTGKVSLVEYPDKVKIFPQGQASIEYILPEPDIKNEKFSPDGIKTNPYEPKYIKKPCHEEERQLRSKGEACYAYLDFIKSKDCHIKQKSRFIRQLYDFSRRMAPALFEAAIQRALDYRIVNIQTLMRISHQLMKEELDYTPEITPVNDYEQRKTYQQGRFSLERDLKYYQDILHEKEDDEETKEK